MRPKISIIIPIYNKINYLDKCLDSVINQDYKNFECILVDDGSNDGSEHMCDIWAQKDNRFLVFHQNNGGVSNARNNGYKVASGEYIYFLDADDMITNDCLSLLSNCLTKHNTLPDMVIGSVEIRVHNNIQFLTLKDESIKSVDAFNSYKNHLWYEMPVNKLISKDFLKKNEILFYPGIRNEDTLWSFITALKTPHIVLCSAITYIYNVNETSYVSNINNKSYVDNLLIVCREMKKELEKTANIEPDYINYFIYFLTDILISKLFKFDLPITYKFSSYKLFRSYFPRAPFIHFIKSKYPLFFKILYFHKIFPNFIGFTYFQLLLNIYHKIK